MPSPLTRHYTPPRASWCAVFLATWREWTPALLVFPAVLVAAMIGDLM